MNPALPALPGVRHRDVTVDGVRLHVAEAGEGPAVVLQHGWPQHWWAWRNVLAALAQRHRVICPDLRGLGWSQGGGRDAGAKERLASDLLGVLDALDVDRCVLAGHDWGGFVGFIACLRAPERFSGYLAMSILHPWPTGNRPDPRALPRAAYQMVIATPGVGSTLLRQRGIVERFLKVAGAGAWDAAALARYTEVLARPPAADASVAIYRSFLLSELVPIMRGRYVAQRLEVPCRLLVGAEDPVITPDVVMGFEPFADDMTLEWVPGAGHWLPEERPELVVERIEELSGAS